MQTVAELWLVLELTDSGIALGVLTGLHFTPLLVGGVYGGLVADRVDKRRLLLVTQTLQAVLALVLWAVTAAGVTELWMVFLLAFLSGCVTAFDNPTRRAFTFELVANADLSNAASLNSTLMSFTRIIGPAIAGVLIGTVGVSICFLVNGLSFVAVLLALVAIDVSTLRTPVREGRQAGQLREGFRYAWSTPSVRLPLAMMAVVGILALNFPVILPLLATDEFGGGAGMLGLLLTLTSVGNMIGALAIAIREVVDRQVLAASSIVLGGGILATSAAPGLVLGTVALVVVGVGTGAFVASTNAAVQVHAAAAMQGRMVALHAILFLGSTPLGGPLIGWIAESAGARISFAVGGVAALATGVVAMSRRPAAANPRLAGRPG
jgi:MFS family permease